MTDDLLIASRVALLKHGLKTVQDVLDDFDESRGPFMRQLDVVRDAELVRLVTEVTAMGPLLTTAAAKVQISAPATYGEIRSLARTLEDRADLILDRLDTLMEELAQPLHRLAISKEELKNGMNGSTLSAQASKLDDDLELVAEKVKGAVTMKAAGDDAGARNEFALAWQGLEQASLNSDAVFREYVDFLGGLALRETGFDRGLCRIADRFVRDWEDTQNWPWSSWTIPARHEAREVTMARVLRLGFPEWSLWALPLAAHEFAYVALEGARLAPVVTGRSDFPDVRTLVADIFASYVAGPAYASALFILRLSPPTPSAPPDVPDDATADDAVPSAPATPPDTALARAYVTLKTLEALDAHENPLEPTADVREKLSAYWDAALDQVDPQPVLEAARRNELDALVDRATRRIGTDFKFPLHRWADVENWADLLRARQESAIQPDQEDEVRMALNAAWLARLFAPAKEHADIAFAGRALAERIMYPPTIGDGNGTGPSGSNKVEGAGGPVR